MKSDKRYVVSVRAKFPACGERPGEFEVDAQNKVEAIRKARQSMFFAGHTRQDGPLIFSAAVAGPRYEA